MESKEMEITLLHMSGSFLGPLFLGAPYSGKSKRSSSGSWPWSWLSMCSGSQLFAIFTHDLCESCCYKWVFDAPRWVSL